MFQPDLCLKSAEPFVPRPDVHGAVSDDNDEQVADLQYRDAYELAVGHNVAAQTTHDDGVCRQVNSASMPSADVEKVVPRKLSGVQLGMEALAAAESAEAIRAMVGPIVSEYHAWIVRQGARRRWCVRWSSSGRPTSRSSAVGRSR